MRNPPFRHASPTYFIVIFPRVFYAVQCNNMYPDKMLIRTSLASSAFCYIRFFPFECLSAEMICPTTILFEFRFCLPTKPVPGADSFSDFNSFNLVL